MAGVIVMFKATEKYRYHNDVKHGRVDNGDFLEVSPGEAEKLVKDYPDNFVILDRDQALKAKKQQAKQAKGETKEVKESKTQTK